MLELQAEALDRLVAVPKQRSQRPLFMMRVASELRRVALKVARQIEADMHVLVDVLSWRSFACSRSISSLRPAEEHWEPSDPLSPSKHSLVSKYTMSGIEVVGVVLGALPLIISAFEHAQSFAKKWDLLANFNSENLKVWNDIKDEELMYRLQLQTLLAPLVRDGDLTKNRLESLLLSPQSDAWREADLDTALRQRLGEAYDRYFGNIEEIQVLAWQLLEPLTRSSAFRTQISTKVRRT